MAEGRNREMEERVRTTQKTVFWIVLLKRNFRR